MDLVRLGLGIFFALHGLIGMMKYIFGEWKTPEFLFLFPLEILLGFALLFSIGG